MIKDLMPTPSMSDTELQTHLINRQFWFLRYWLLGAGDANESERRFAEIVVDAIRGTYDSWTAKLRSHQ